MAPSEAKKRRRAITDVERKALREFYHDQSNTNGGRPSGKDMRHWFETRFHHLPSESTISEILSSKYARLDEDLSHPAAKKNRPALYPDLEIALFDWQQRMQTNEAAITGELLQEMASKLWDKLSQYEGVEKPKFSTGWLCGFKERYGIKKQIRHGEAGSVDKETIEAQLEELRIVLDSYDNEDIYNMDESALYWKATPEATLATVATSGKKTCKARVTVNLCCNASGTHKFAPWFLGTAAKPRCFAAAGVNIKNLPMEWRSNQKGWMTSRIFFEYLIWFNRQMIGRKVILLVDNFSAHITGLELIKNDVDIELNNVKVSK